MIKKINQKFFIKFTVVLIFCFLVYSNSNALENKILFKVNNEIITSIDIINEIEYLSLLNNNLKSLDKEKIFEIAKNSLLRENLLLKYCTPWRTPYIFFLTQNILR